MSNRMLTRYETQTFPKTCRHLPRRLELAELLFAFVFLQGSGPLRAAPGSFTATTSSLAVEQPNSGKTIGTLEAKKVYRLLKTGGPGGNWCKLQLPEGSGWILCSQGSMNDAPQSDAPLTKVGGPPQGSGAVKGTAGGFDYYLLSLSWSPAFCATHEDRVTQCGVDKHFGFVIHGLWPQYDRGGYPQSCPGAEKLDAALVEQLLPLMPDPNLINHEWQKHGTCSGLSPKDYFAKATAAYQSLRIPEALKLPKSAVTTTLAQIEQDFQRVNPGLTGDMMSVSCKGRVSEIRFCFDKELRLRRCGPGVRDNCPGSATFLPTR